MRQILAFTHFATLWHSQKLASMHHTEDIGFESSEILKIMQVFEVDQVSDNRGRRCVWCIMRRVAGCDERLLLTDQ